MKRIIKSLLIISIIILINGCTKSHPKHSHTCHSSDIYHGYSEKEYQEIQEEMDEIRFLMDDLEKRVN
jgi:hypothetical protein